MPIIHIVLDCASPTAHNDGAYRTLVIATESEYRDGLHLQQAARRAAILGYGGPHHVRESRRLDPDRVIEARDCQAPDELLAPSMRARLDLLVPEDGAAIACPADQRDAEPPVVRSAIWRRVGVRSGIRR
jgi:hypothetical protein